MCSVTKMINLDFVQQFYFEVVPVPDVNVIGTVSDPPQGTSLVRAHLADLFSANHGTECKEGFPPHILRREVKEFARPVWVPVPHGIGNVEPLTRVKDGTF